MKTPREILLARHQAAEPKLDAVRERALASLAQPEREGGSSFALRAGLALWRELILPCRRVWGGLAAAWLVIAVLHLSTGRSPELAAARSAAPGVYGFMALREQERILAELLNPAAPALVSPPAPAPRAVPPGPRGDVRQAAAMG